MRAKTRRNWLQAPWCKPDLLGPPIHPKLNVFLPRCPHKADHTAFAAFVFRNMSLIGIFEGAVRTPVLHELIEHVLRARLLIRASPKRVRSLVFFFPEKLEKLGGAPVLRIIPESEIQNGSQNDENDRSDDQPPEFTGSPRLRLAVAFQIACHDSYFAGNALS